MIFANGLLKRGYDVDFLLFRHDIAHVIPSGAKVFAPRSHWSTFQQLSALVAAIRTMDRQMIRLKYLRWAPHAFQYIESQRPRVIMANEMNEAAAVSLIFTGSQARRRREIPWICRQSLCLLLRRRPVRSFVKA